MTKTKKDTKVTNIMRNVMPAFAVMALGLGGAYLVYENYFSDRIEGSAYSSIAPAAGMEMSEVEGMDHMNSEMVVQISDETATDDTVVEEMVEDAGEAMEAVGEAASDAADAVVEAGQKAEDEDGSIAYDSAAGGMTDDEGMSDEANEAAHDAEEHPAH